MSRVFAAPAVIAAIGLCGLLGALVWDGTGERVAVMAVALPLCVVAWAIRRRRD